VHTVDASSLFQAMFSFWVLHVHSNVLWQVRALIHGVNIVLSFWVRMPPETQRHILKLASSCKTVDKICVFKAQEFTKPDDGISVAA
jgi:hypothetical protein